MFVRPKVEKIMCDWKKEAFGYTPPKWDSESRRKRCRRSLFAYTFDGETLTIYSDDPGILIGYHGKMIYEYSEKIKDQSPEIKKVVIRETFVPRGMYKI